MWPLERPGRHDRPSRLVDQALDASRIVRLPRNQDLELIRQADQPAVKHPVRRAREGNAIAENIGATCLHGPDMGGRRVVIVSVKTGGPKRPSRLQHDISGPSFDLLSYCFHSYRMPERLRF